MRQHVHVAKRCTDYVITASQPRRGVPHPTVNREAINVGWVSADLLQQADRMIWAGAAAAGAAAAAAERARRHDATARDCKATWRRRQWYTAWPQLMCVHREVCTHAQVPLEIFRIGACAVPLQLRCSVHDGEHDSVVVDPSS
jgi:hypothetical protein